MGPKFFTGPIETFVLKIKQMRTVFLHTSMFVSCRHDACNFYLPQRSLGQGNVFTHVCHSVHRGEGGSAQPPPDADPPGLGRPPRYSQQAGGTHPAGMYTCSPYFRTRKNVPLSQEYQGFSLGTTITYAANSGSTLSPSSSSSAF